MKPIEATKENITRNCGRLAAVALAVALIPLGGCGGRQQGTSETKFFTSGSREADQRASQKMAKEKQVSESEKGTGVLAEKKLSLYERLGAEAGLAKIVDDFTQRVLQDPRVNWQRLGNKSGVFGKKSDGWQSTPENVAVLKKHMVQFLSLATGGPAKYDGKGIKASHEGMKITNPEFDASIGDLKASLDKLQIADREQKELLAIVESTRPQIVTER